MLIAGILAWRFLFSDGATPVQPQPARAPAQEQNTQSAQVETAQKQSNAPSEPPAAPDERTAVRTFVEDWFKAVSSNGAQDAMRFYAPRVDYYQRGWVPLAYVQSDKAQFFERWPIQNNTIALDAAGNAQNREFYWRHESAK